MTQSPGVLAGIVDGAAALWWRRRSALRAPHVDLAELARIDEQMEAHLASFLIGARRHGTAPLDDEAEEDDAISFLRCVLRLAGVTSEGGLHGLADQLAGAAPAAAIAALVWADRSTARPAVDALLATAEPAARALAIAAIGARRTDVPDEVLERLAADPEPLPRARAFRTIGQLGRRALLPRLLSARAEEDAECRFWAAWSAARMGETSTLGILAEIARGTSPRADAALEMLLRRATIEQSNAWLSAFARNHPERRRSLVRATGILGDPLYVPWLLACMEEPDIARLAGEAVATITGLEIAYLDLDRDAPEGFEAGPNDDAGDDNVELDDDEWLPWPDMQKVGAWWRSNGSRFPAGTAFFLGQPKQSANWLGALGDAFQRQRLAAALELAIRQPDKPMFEARARGRLQRQQLMRAGGAVSSAGSSAPS